MKNYKRRITAEERVDVLFETFRDAFITFDTRFIKRDMIKMLGDHVKAAHKRHARKNVCFRPGQKGFEVVKDYREKMRLNPTVDE